MTLKALKEDKERMDQITEKIANKEKMRLETILYWTAVAIGHLLEWTVTHGKPKD